MLGGTGDDELAGGKEVDIMTGGAGADVYEYRGKIAFFPKYETGVGAGNRDKITDFDAAAGDRFDFVSTPLVDEFVGDGPVGEREVGFFETATRTIIVGNDDADPTAEFEIELVGTDLGLTADNFDWEASIGVFRSEALIASICRAVGSSHELEDLDGSDLPESPSADA